MLSVPPNSSQRKQCWTSRDEYWNCLDKNGLWLHGLRPRIGGNKGTTPPLPAELSTSEPTRENPFQPPIKGENKVTINRELSEEEVKQLSVCEEFKNAFEASCPHSWVEHFNTKRIADCKMKLLQEQAEKDNARLAKEYERSKK